MPLHWKNPWDRKLSKQVLNWHKITWEIIKGRATKEIVSFHREQSKEEDLSGKNEKIYTLKHASDSPASALKVNWICLVYHSLKPVLKKGDGWNMDQLQQSRTVMTLLNLKLLRLTQVKAKIMNAVAELLGATDVTPLNFWLHALFSQIDI